MNEKRWMKEEKMSMMMKNIEKDVEESKNEMVVYGGIGRDERKWEDLERIVEKIKKIKEEEKMMVKQGKKVGVLRNKKEEKRVLIEN